MGRLEARRAEIEAKGARLCAVCVDSIEKSQAVVQKRKLGFPILSDPAGDTMRAYGVWHESAKIALPAAYVVGHDGKVAWRYVAQSVEDRPSEDEIVAAVSQAAR